MRSVVSVEMNADYGERVRFAHPAGSLFSTPKQFPDGRLSSRILWGRVAHMRLGKRLLID
jgi:hypothetical protein